MRLVARVALIAVLSVAVLATACGSAGSGPPPGGSKVTTPVPTSVPTTTAATTLDMTVTTTGDVAASGSFTWSLGTATSCAGWVAAGKSFDLELTAAAEPVGGMGFEMVVGIATPTYQGPGVYTIDHNGLLQTFDLGSHEFSLHGATLTVKADGSGSITFSDEPDVLGDIDSGAISWTCS